MIMAPAADLKANYNNMVRLSNTEFQLLARLVYDHCGINLVENKKILLESRLNKRLTMLSVTTFKDYIQYLTSKDGLANELTHMIDVVTTNKTDFFREPRHFEFMQQRLLPEFYKQHSHSTYHIWSAASSTGEEPYTLAMVMEDFAHGHPGFNYSIFASDISTEVLQKAVQAVYDLRLVDALPLAIKQKYLLKSKDKIKPRVRVIPELRKKVRFAQVNLMDKVLRVDQQFDAIFCRNVLIYFDRATQLEVVRKLADKIKLGGYLFIGHSESIFNHHLPLVQIEPTIFQRI